jgi:hypothetical protein
VTNCAHLTVEWRLGRDWAERRGKAGCEAESSSCMAWHGMAWNDRLPCFFSFPRPAATGSWPEGGEMKVRQGSATGPALGWLDGGHRDEI